MGARAGARGTGRAVNLHEHLPRNLRDCDVVEVEVVGPFRVRVTHRDGTAAVHRFDPSDFRGDFAALRDAAMFATAQVVDGYTLGWKLPGGLIYDVALDSLWLHAHGHCDRSCGVHVEVER